MLHLQTIQEIKRAELPVAERLLLDHYNERYKAGWLNACFFALANIILHAAGQDPDEEGYVRAAAEVEIWDEQQGVAREFVLAYVNDETGQGIRATNAETEEDYQWGPADFQDAPDLLSKLICDGVVDELGKKSVPVWPVF